MDNLIKTSTCPATFETKLIHLCITERHAISFFLSQDWSVTRAVSVDRGASITITKVESGGKLILVIIKSMNVKKYP